MEKKWCIYLIFTQYKYLRLTDGCECFDFLFYFMYLYFRPLFSITGSEIRRD
jgi:hypothetical protein